jgi:hypothetical protein
MKAPTSIKDIQKLTGCMAALNRFISKLGERGSPSSNYSSTKRSLCGLQRRIKPLPSSRTSYRSRQSSRLLARASSYCSTSLRLLTWSAIIVERREDGHAYPVQRPVYFISEVLSESKAHYQPVQKLLYAVLITSQKLRHYFQEYSIFVVTDYPLGDIPRNQDATRRISKWQSSSAPSPSTSSHAQPSSRRR